MKTTSNVKRGVLMGRIVLLSVLTLGEFAAGQVCVQPPVGLVSWWPGDGSAQDIQGEADGVLVGQTAFVPGVSGQAFSMDGTGDWVKVPHHPSLDLDTLTVDFWVKPRVLPSSGNKYFVSRPNSVGNNLWSLGFAEGGSPNLQGFVRGTIGGINCDVTGPPLTAGEWQHVAMTLDGTTVRLFRNGLEVAVQSCPATLEPDVTNLFLGTFIDVALDGSEIPSPIHSQWDFEGELDEVELFGRALSRSEIQAIFNAGSAGKCKDADGDGVPDTQDNCPNSIVTPTVVIGGCDSGVPNTVFPNGCTISDRIQQCAVGAQNHGQFVSCVAHLTNELKRAGIITGQQKGAIQSCAAQANIP